MIDASVAHVTTEPSFALPAAKLLTTHGMLGFLVSPPLASLYAQHSAS